MPRGDLSRHGLGDPLQCQTRRGGAERGNQRKRVDDVADGRKEDDRYALAVVAYELLTGEPFDAWLSRVAA